MKKTILIICMSMLLILGGCNKREADRTIPSEQATNVTVSHTDPILEDIPTTATEEYKSINATTEAIENTEPLSTGESAIPTRSTSTNDNKTSKLPSSSSEQNTPQESIAEKEPVNSGNIGAEAFDEDMSQPEYGNEGSEIFD